MTMRPTTHSPGGLCLNRPVKTARPASGSKGIGYVGNALEVGDALIRAKENTP